jgi:thymidylate synthase ThyX
MARTRVGAVFSAKGMRDNNWKDCGVRIPTALWNNKEYIGRVMDEMLEVKKLYADIVDSGKGSWQAARTILPLYVVYGYSATYNYNTLRGVCANRMKFCEMEDTVAIAWLMAQEVSKVFPLLGSYLRPGCDYAGKCTYHQSYAMSEMFGCLFKECGRNKCENSDGYAEFNETCTNYKDLEEQLKMHITRPNEWKTNSKFEDLSPRDKYLFMED